MSHRDDEDASAARLLTAWCAEQGCDDQDARLLHALGLVPAPVWRLVLEGDEPSVVLRWLGDPASRSHPFWRQVAPARTPLVPASERAGWSDGHGQTCYSMPLDELLQALRRTRRIARTTSDREHAREAHSRFSRLQAEQDRRAAEARRQHEESEGERLDRLDRERVADNAAVARVPADDREPDDFEDEVSDLETDEVLESGDAGEADGSPYGDDDEIERELADAIDEGPDDPIASLLSHVRRVLADLHTTFATQRALPQEVLRLADAFNRRGCPAGAAWQFAKGQAELEAARRAAAAPSVEDFAGQMLHLNKGLEILLEARFGQVLEGLRRSNAIQMQGWLDSLGAYAFALGQVAVRWHGRWPEGVPSPGAKIEAAGAGSPFTPAPGQVADLGAPERLAWITVAVQHVADVFRNGYTHSHRAGASVAERFVAFMLGEGGLLDFLLRHGTPVPSPTLRGEIQGSLPRRKRRNESDEPMVELCETPVHGWLCDDRLYRPDELRPATRGSTAARPDAGLDADANDEGNIRASGQGACPPGIAIYHPDDVEVLHGKGQARTGRWPVVQLHAVVMTQEKGPRTISLGALAPERSTLAWRWAADRVRIVWGAPAAMASSARVIVELVAHQRSGPESETSAAPSRMRPTPEGRPAPASPSEIVIEDDE